jgi:hypothetical protein
MKETNLIHLKRALFYIPERFKSIQFDSAGEIVIDNEIKNEFEFAPDEYDYTIKNEIIDQAFAVFLSVPFVHSRKLTAIYSKHQKRVFITVQHDDKITFRGGYLKK